MKMIHCADLHLSEDEKEYALSVLDAIVAVTVEEKADLLVFAGDVFNTFHDVEILSGEFRKRVGTLTCDVLVLPGNHDLQGIGANKIDRVDFGNQVIALTQQPFQLIERCGVEFLAIPFQRSLKDYVNWPVPPKAPGKRRVAIAHGTVADMAIYTGGSDEVEDGAMDSNIFTRFQADYVAMGHIHGRRFQSFGSTLIHYPGSARVWRQHEDGPRGVNLVTIDDRVAVEFRELKSSGQYYHYAIPVSLDGKIDIAPAVAEGWGIKDWVSIECLGIVEDQGLVVQAEEALRKQYKSRVRKFNIDHPGLSIAAGIAAHPLAEKFLEIWKGKEPVDPKGREIWLKARELGLIAIKEELESRHD